MRVKITKGGIYNAKGEEVAVGTEVTLKKEPIGWEGRYEVISGGSDGKTAVSNPATAFEAKHRGGGSYSVMDAEGKEVLSGLTKDDAGAFNAMSEEDKAAFVASENAKKD